MLSPFIVVAALALAGCATESAFDQLAGLQPTGDAFTQALFKDYSLLARSFGKTASASGSAFDSGDSMSLTGVDSDVADIAEAFAAKAVRAANGENVLPEPAPEGDDTAEKTRLRLLQALDEGRDKAPEHAARAQVDYDCWILNGRVDSQRTAALACLRSLQRSLAQLERDVNPPPVAPAPAPTSDYTVYFDFDSWTLSAEALGTLQQAIDAARNGGQTRIACVGHTDTSGSTEYNQKLSEKRAGVVRDVLVQMGARPESITVSGTGENDLAVATGDGVREPKNRRTVVTLVP